MKRTERRHLKDNELAHLAASTKRAVEAHKRQVAAITVAIVAVLAAVIGYFAWGSRVERRAHAMLAQALAVDDAQVAPAPEPGKPQPGGLRFPTERDKDQAALAKFKEVADQYPSTDAGLLARYREAGAYMALGEPAKAAAAYQQVLDRAGNSLYAQVARLGLAEAQAKTGQYEPAITIFKDLAQQKDGPIPVDGILMRLGRTYLEAGKTADAEQTFNRLVDEFPDSLFSADARRALDQLKKS